MNVKIIIDTSVWIEYFRNNKDFVQFIEENLDMENIYITGPIISELLQGVRSSKEYESLSESLEGLPYENTVYDDWKKSGQILFDLKKKAITIPVTDAIIGSVALRLNAAILSLDSHFKHISGLKMLEIP
jgi:tRNA(fMet)-specific endonuclease VapC